MKNKLLSALAVALSCSSASYAQTATLYGITSANAIFSMSNVSDPSSINGPYSVSGVASGQVLAGLDVRPSNGAIYALGYDSIAHMAELYRITNSGSVYTATAVSGTLASMDLGNTNNIAFDIVSTTDNQIRVMGRNGNHYIMNTDNGTVMSTGSGSLSYATGDVHAASSAVLGATAYTNSYYGSDATQQIGYDVANNVLVRFDAGSYSNGWNNAATTMHSVGATTGAVLLATGSIGMDTWYDTTNHHNIMFMTASTLVAGAHLYRYDMNDMLGVGTLTDVGAIGSGTLQVRDIAFDHYRDSTAAITGRMVTALSLNMRNLIYFDSEHPDNIRRRVSLSGMTSGQTMVGIDYSPTGALYGLGYNSTNQTYQLYIIDSVTGHVSAVNTTAGTLHLGTDDGSGNRINAGFRFISTASNRIRVIGNNGATNVQLDATNGTIAATNTGMSYVTGDANFGATANLSSIAYTGYNGDASTQLFGFDANTGAMVMFSATNGTSGYGDGASGYIMTSTSLSSVIDLLLHTNTYNNAHMNIMYDQAASANTGFFATNYMGDSSDQTNYSVMYDITSMLTAYHRGTAGAPARTGSVGYGIPVKDVSSTRYYSATPSTGIVAYAGNDDLLVYPNPAVSNARIALPYPSVGKVSVAVVSMNGNIARSFSYEPKSNWVDVDMSKLPAGLYSVRVSGAGIGTHNLKLEKSND